MAFTVPFTGFPYGYLSRMEKYFKINKVKKSKKPTYCNSTMNFQAWLNFSHNDDSSQINSAVTILICYICVVQKNQSMEWWNRTLSSEHSLCTHFQCGVCVQDGYNWRKLYRHFKCRQNCNQWCNTAFKCSSFQLELCSYARYFHYASFKW